jgi:hypothetical protein
MPAKKKKKKKFICPLEQSAQMWIGTLFKLLKEEILGKLLGTFINKVITNLEGLRLA